MPEHQLPEHHPEHGQLLDHEYDGIREYDNPTPSWWHAIFFACIFWGLFYFVFMHTSPIAPLPDRTWKAAQQGEFQRLFAGVGQFDNDQATILANMNDDKWMTLAASLFRGRCVSCHGGDGQGLVGPNMTDDKYKNIEKLEDFYGVISNGAAAGAMPAWKNQLNNNEIVLLSSYVASLRGRNLDGPGVDGEATIPPWPEAPQAPQAPQEDG